MMKWWDIMNTSSESKIFQLDDEDIELMVKALRDLQKKSIKDRYNHIQNLIEKLKK